MFEVITRWNLARPETDFNIEIRNIEIRGYKKESFLTGEFASKIKTKEIRVLSVSDIADYLCPERRDLYIKKGKNRPKGRTIKKTWGSVAGRVVENYIFNLVRDSSRRKNLNSYSEIRKNLDAFSNNFKANHKSYFNELEELKSRPDEAPGWLLRLLTYNGRAELGLKLLHNYLARDNSEIDKNDIKINKNDSLNLQPNAEEIGISSPVKPDFIIVKHKVVGDIKSGIGGFKDYYLLTCTGYALAYENQTKKDINFGIIYYFPTRYSKYARPISFAQVYTFLINDSLRTYFKNIRNKAYEIVSRDAAPNFPAEKDHCPYCQFYDICKHEGLSL